MSRAKDLIAAIKELRLDGKGKNFSAAEITKMRKDLEGSYSAEEIADMDDNEVLGAWQSETGYVEPDEARKSENFDGQSGQFYMKIREPKGLAKAESRAGATVLHPLPNGVVRVERISQTGQPVKKTWNRAEVLTNEGWTTIPISGRVRFSVAQDLTKKHKVYVEVGDGGIRIESTNPNVIDDIVADLKAPTSMGGQGLKPGTPQAAK